MKKSPKLPPRYKHQQKLMTISKDKIAFAFLMEMGTGKTRPIIETAEHLFEKGEIEALVVLSPNGVQRNWVLNEIPKWCRTKYRAAWWTSNPNRKQADAITKLTARPFNGLRILTANYESCNILSFKNYVKKFMRSFKNMAVLDESTRIKNPQAKRTKFIVDLRKFAQYRRIMSGFVTPQSPFDVYKQFEFLDPAILGFSSVYTFKAHFAEIEDNKFLLAAIQKRSQRSKPFTNMITPMVFEKFKMSNGMIVSPNGTGTITVPTYLMQEAEQHGFKMMPNPRQPQLVKKHPTTKEPLYRNLDELNELIAPHSFRVMKKDCLDLPEKIYGRLPVELTDRQRSVYDQVANDFIAEFEGGEVTTAMAIVRLIRLQQITGGFIQLDDERDIRPIDGKFPKVEALMESIEDNTGKVAVWTHYQHENVLIADYLREAYGDKSVVQYFGGVSNNNKQIAVDRFQNIIRDKNGNKISENEEESGARFFVGEPHSGGIGIELTLAEDAYYHSNSHNLEDRLQSEDRHHRSGTRHPVNYRDIEAINSIDQLIIEALRAKKDVAHVIMGDGLVNWIGREA
jgi:SNF2 family DNA or RNA helicase